MESPYKLPIRVANLKYNYTRLIEYSSCVHDFLDAYAGGEKKSAMIRAICPAQVNSSFTRCMGTGQETVTFCAQTDMEQRKLPQLRWRFAMSQHKYSIAAIVTSGIGQPVRVDSSSASMNMHHKLFAYSMLKKCWWPGGSPRFSHQCDRRPLPPSRPPSWSAQQPRPPAHPRPHCPRAACP